MKIMKAGSRPTKKASSDWFTGTVRQDPIIEVPEPARVRALKVAFELGLVQLGTLTLWARPCMWSVALALWS